MLWSDSSRVYVSTCQHEALKYGNLPSKDNALPFSCAYAGTCQHETLKRESFLRQMLGESFKLLPVLVWGMAVADKCTGTRP